MAPGGADSPALPVELWGQVASFLSLREACMLASTCRALWAMDLLSVTLEGWGERAPGGDTSAPHCNCSEWHMMKDTRCRRYPACAELAWAAKRWSCARLLKVDIREDNAEELSQALACDETNDLACLEEVCCVVPLSVRATSLPHMPVSRWGCNTQVACGRRRRR